MGKSNGSGLPRDKGAKKGQLKGKKNGKKGGKKTDKTDKSSEMTMVGGGGGSSGDDDIDTDDSKDSDDDALVDDDAPTDDVSTDDTTDATDDASTDDASTDDATDNNFDDDLDASVGDNDDDDGTVTNDDVQLIDDDDVQATDDNANNDDQGTDDTDSGSDGNDTTDDPTDDLTKSDDAVDTTSIVGGLVTLSPSISPTVSPETSSPVAMATQNPTTGDTGSPDSLESASPTVLVSDSPTLTASTDPTALISDSPTVLGSMSPTSLASMSPTLAISANPTVFSSVSPTMTVSDSPTSLASMSPTLAISANPTVFSSVSPTMTVSDSPTISQQSEASEVYSCGDLSEQNTTEVVVSYFYTLETDPSADVDSVIDEIELQITLSVVAELVDCSRRLQRRRLATAIGVSASPRDASTGTCGDNCDDVEGGMALITTDDASGGVEELACEATAVIRNQIGSIETSVSGIQNIDFVQDESSTCDAILRAGETGGEEDGEGVMISTQEELTARGLGPGRIAGIAVGVAFIVVVAALLTADRRQTNRHDSHEFIPLSSEKGSDIESLSVATPATGENTESYNKESPNRSVDTITPDNSPPRQMIAQFDPAALDAANAAAAAVSTSRRIECLSIPTVATQQELAASGGANDNSASDASSTSSSPSRVRLLGIFRSRSNDSDRSNEEIMAEAKTITGDDVVPGGKGYSKSGGVFGGLFGGRKNPDTSVVEGDGDSDGSDAASSDDSNDATLEACDYIADGIGIDAAPQARGWGKRHAQEKMRYPMLEYEASKPSAPPFDPSVAEIENATEEVEPPEKVKKSKSSKSKSPRKKRRRPMEKMACIPEMNEAIPEMQDLEEDSESSETGGSHGSQSTSSSESEEKVFIVV